MKSAQSAPLGSKGLRRGLTRPGKRDEALRFSLGVPGRAVGDRLRRGRARAGQRAPGASGHDSAHQGATRARPGHSQSPRGRALGDRLHRRARRERAARARLFLARGTFEISSRKSDTPKPDARSQQHQQQQRRHRQRRRTSPPRSRRRQRRPGGHPRPPARRSRRPPQAPRPPRDTARALVDLKADSHAAAAAACGGGRAYLDRSFLFALDFGTGPRTEQRHADDPPAFEELAADAQALLDAAVEVSDAGAPPPLPHENDEVLWATIDAI